MAGSDDEDFAALFAASEGARTRERRVAAGDVVRGRVIAVGAAAAFVAVGGKAEATIELAEFRDPVTGEVQLHEGDEIEATVVDDGTRSGSIVLKRVAGRGGHVPGELEQAFAHGIAIEGLVTGENKGGYDVQIGSVRAFCPGSQIDRRRIEGAQYVGQRLRFRITKLEAGGRNVVVSRRQLLEEEAAQQARVVWAELRVGAVVAGTVTSLRDFGAFVDLGGVDRGYRRGHGGRARSREAAHRPLDGRARQAGEGRGRGRGAARHREGARPVEREAEPRNAGRSAREVAEVEALSIREGSADVRARGDRIRRRHGGVFSHRPFVLTGARRGTRSPRGSYAPRGGFAMTARRMHATVALTLLAAGVVASTARAVLPCNRKYCLEEILACEAAAGCDDLSGAGKSG